MNQEEIRKILTESYDIPRVTQVQLQLLEYLSIHPKTKTAMLCKKFNTIPDPTIYRVINNLRALTILDDSNTVCFKEAFKSRFFQLPQHIRNGLLPPSQYLQTHVAAYLTKFKRDEYVPGLGTSKQAYLEQFKSNLESQPDKLKEIVYRLQNDLATIALYLGELSSFEEMHGTLHIEKEGN